MPYMETMMSMKRNGSGFLCTHRSRTRLTAQCVPRHGLHIDYVPNSDLGDVAHALSVALLWLWEDLVHGMFAPPPG